MSDVVKGLILAGNGFAAGFNFGILLSGSPAPAVTVACIATCACCIFGLMICDAVYSSKNAPTSGKVN